MGRAGRRLLLLDADDASRVLFKHMYTVRGHQVWLAATAAESIEIVQAEVIEVVVYDWSFRDQSGIGLAGRLRAVSKWPLAIVALSVLDEPDGFREREGVDDYVVKPALAEAVELAFESVLATRRRP